MDALVALGRHLRDRGYAFITPTPETHRRVLARGTPARTLRDVFGWSKPFDRDVLPDDIFALLREAGGLLEEGGRFRSAVRFSSLEPLLLAHSAYPTTAADAVFFGPDTYRFASYLLARAPDRIGSLADVGCGTGAGGLLLAPRCERVDLLDVNRTALRLARANAEVNQRDARVTESDVLSGLRETPDLIVANPPYLADEAHRAYRDGGADLGTALSIRIVEESLDRLRPGGRLLLYTATPVLEGEHLLRRKLAPLLRRARAGYAELDPDVFGEELERPAYGDVERIAVVGVDAVKL